jgi:hypothetical protein
VFYPYNRIRLIIAEDRWCCVNKAKGSVHRLNSARRGEGRAKPDPHGVGAENVKGALVFVWQAKTFCFRRAFTGLGAGKEGRRV